MVALIPPIFDDIEQVVLAGKFLPSPDSYIPQADPKDFKADTIYPIVSPYPGKGFEQEIKPGNWNQNVEITIWNRFPELANCETEAEYRSEALRITFAYVQRLKWIKDELLSQRDDSPFVNRDYTLFPGSRVNYLPKNRRGAFIFGLDFKSREAEFADTLIGPTVAFTINGPVEHFCCPNPYDTGIYSPVINLA